MGGFEAILKELNKTEYEHDTEFKAEGFLVLGSSIQG
jgi:hypothetical protein